MYDIASSIVITAAGAAFAFFVCSYLYITGTREIYLRPWIYSWALHILYSLAAFWYVKENHTLLVAAENLLVLSALAFWWGADLYVTMSNRLKNYLVTAAITAGLFMGVVFGDGGDTLLRIITSFMAGGIYLISGSLFLHNEKKGLGHRAMGWILLAFGLHHLVFIPMNSLFPEIAALNNLLMAGLEAMITVNILMIAWEDTRERQVQHLQEAVLSLAATVEARDAYTINHSQHVATMSASIAKKMGFNHQDIERIHFAGLLHDIGKIGIPDYILQKPGKLSTLEFTEIKKHPEAGFQILKAAGGTFTPILPLVKHHHERWDGNGYPSRLKEKEIPLGAAILAVADSYDAIISNRSYRDAQVEAKAMEEIKAGSGKQFHPLVVKIFLENQREITGQFQKESFTLMASAMEKKHLDPGRVPIEETGDQAKFIRPFDYRVRYKGILDAVGDAVLIFSEWKIIDWSKKAEEVYGYLPIELDGMRARDLISSRESRSFEEYLEDPDATNELVFKSEHIKKDGTLFPVEVSMCPFVQDGRLCWIAVIRDVSREKSREREMQEREWDGKHTENYVAKVLGNLSHESYLVSSEHVVVSANELAQKRGVVPGQHCHTTIFNNPGICPYCRAAEGLAFNKITSMEIVVAGKKLTAYWVPVGNGLFLHSFVDDK